MIVLLWLLVLDVLRLFVLEVSLLLVRGVVDARVVEAEVMYCNVPYAQVFQRLLPLLSGYDWLLIRLRSIHKRASRRWLGRSERNFPVLTNLLRVSSRLQSIFIQLPATSILCYTTTHKT